MGKKPSPIHLAVKDSINNGVALTAKNIRDLRDKSTQSIKAYKLSFWVAIAVLNLVIWVPLPINRSVLITVAFLSIAFAFIAPILGIRKHQRNLDLLEDCSPGPKKRRASDPGKIYIGQVKEEGRAFIRAEVEVLEGDREPAGSDLH